MFELLKPKKDEVGKRLRQVKEELGVSFSEFGNRLGLIKPTINAYVRGDNLAPLDVIEKISKITDKSVGWLYFGEIEEYIRDYLLLKGERELLDDYPNLPLIMKGDFLLSKRHFVNIETQENEQRIKSKELFENEFGYPAEEYLDTRFPDYYLDYMKEYLKKKTMEAIGKINGLSEEETEEIFAYAFSNVWEYFFEVETVRYNERENLFHIIDECINRWKNLQKESKYTFNEQELAGNLINKLKTKEGTENILYILARELNVQDSDLIIGEAELVNIFQSMRSNLIELYVKKADKDFEFWLET